MKVNGCGNVCRDENPENMDMTCLNCQAKLELIPQDFRADLTRVFPRYYFKCKWCGEWTRVKLKKMTQTFKNEVLALNISM